MKLTSARLLTALFVLAALVLGTRLVWVASTTETGWETLGLSWYNALLGPIGLKREPIGDRDPAEQAEIWLREVDRVVAAHPDDAQIAMGAAWMLDSPGSGFQRKYTKFDNSFSPFIIPDVDEQAVARAEDRFEAKCAARCLELAARATELDPENVPWWRMRALLLLRSGYYTHDFAPRDPDWLTVLDECARHDPDNALYDYLAALRLWITSGDYDWDDNLDIRFLKLDSRERYETGVARFEQGQRKKHLAVGQAALPAVAELLRHTRQPRKEEADVAFERLVGYRADMLPVRLRNWQRARAGTQEQAGNPAKALAFLRQQRRVLKQMVAPGSSSGSRYWASVLDPADIAWLQEFAKKYPTLISAAELAALDREKENLLADELVTNKAHERVGPVTQSQPLLEAPTPVQLTEVTRNLCLLLTTVSMIGWVLARWLLKAERPPPLGRVRHIFAWLVGWGVPLFILGICPAETIGPGPQAKIVAAGASLAGIWILVVVFRILVRLCRTWAQASERLPVVSIVAIITLWQLSLATVLTTVEPFFHGGSSYVLSMTLRRAIPFAVPAALILAGWALFRYRRRTGRLPRAQFVVLGLLGASALLVIGAFALDPGYLGRPCWPPPSDWEGIDGATITGLLNGTRNTSWLGDLAPKDSPAPAEARWLWAFCQWRLHAGLFVSPALSLLLVGVWYAARRARERREAAASHPDPRPRARWGGLIHCLGRSALGMAACCLIAYLALAPGVVRAVESDYQRTIAYIRDPRAYAAKVRRAETAIRSDAAAMKEIRAKVAEQLRWEREDDQANDEQLEIDP